MPYRPSQDETQKMFDAFRKPEVDPEPRAVGILQPFYVTDGHDVIETWQPSMLNALLVIGAPWHEYAITEHAPSRWTCQHPNGFTVKVRAKYEENLSGQKIFFTGRQFCIDRSERMRQDAGTI